MTTPDTTNKSESLPDGQNDSLWTAKDIIKKRPTDSEKLFK